MNKRTKPTKMDIKRMLQLRCFVVIGGLLVITTAADPNENRERCPTIRLTYRMSPYQGKCFQFYYGHKTWHEAKTYCSQNGGRLAMVNDAGTFQFLRTSLNNINWDKVWIGLHDSTAELEWNWVGKHREGDLPMTWSNWNTGHDHPGVWFHDYRDCVYMQNDGGRWLWHETLCNTLPWSYRFICEYDMAPLEPEAGNPNGNDGFHQNLPATSSAATTKQTPTPTYAHTIIRHENTHGEPPRGDHRRVTLPDHMVNSIDGLQGSNRVNIAEKTTEKKHHVPLYAVILAFGAGVIFACGIILFFVLRRKRRVKKEAYPTVLYQAQPASSDDAIGGDIIGAEGGFSVCGTTGKLCKVAVDVGSESGACEKGRPHCHPAHKAATPNVYVSLGQDANSGRCSSPLESSCSSLKDVSSLDEAPPTYDEACAGLEADTIVNERLETAENSTIPDTNETNSPKRHTNGGQGAIPKTPKKAPVVDYLPMDGSTSSDSSPHHTRQDSNQYLPMSLGELPPIPTDDGYEIPVSHTPKVQIQKQLGNEQSVAEHTSRPAGSCVYSEIPDRNSHLYRDDDEIYQTID